jgi:hypothetical protein
MTRSTIVLLASATLVLPVRVAWGFYEAFTVARCGYCGNEGKRKKMYTVDQEQHYCDYDHYRNGTE